MPTWTALRTCRVAAGWLLLAVLASLITAGADQHEEPDIAPFGSTPTAHAPSAGTTTAAGAGNWNAAGPHSEHVMSRISKATLLAERNGAS